MKWITGVAMILTFSVIGMIMEVENLRVYVYDLMFITMFLYIVAITFDK